MPLRFYPGRLKKKVKMITSLASSSNTGAAAFFITPFRYLDKTKPCNSAVAKKASLYMSVSLVNLFRLGENTQYRLFKGKSSKK